jgi:hypothetical protein
MHLPKLLKSFRSSFATMQGAFFEILKIAFVFSLLDNRAGMTQLTS